MPRNASASESEFDSLKYTLIGVDRYADANIFADYYTLCIGRYRYGTETFCKIYQPLPIQYRSIPIHQNPFQKKVSQHLDLRSVLIYSVCMRLASVTSVGDGVCERNWTTSASKACIGIRQEYIAHGDIFF